MYSISKEQMIQLPKIVAIDFDGTLVEDRYPNIGAPNPRVFALCSRLEDKGVHLILWTCRDGKQLDDAVEFCKSKGLIFDAVNENIPEVRKMFNNDTRKVYADLYLDDKSIHIKDIELCADLLGV